MSGKKVLLLLCVLLTGTSLYSQDRSFIFSVDDLSQQYTPTYIGNGNISISSTQLGVMPAHSYMAWIFDHYPGDVARIASLPVWNVVDFFDGISFLSEAQKNVIEKYHQKLDMYNALLHTSYRLNDHGKVTNITVQQFVSRNNANLAAIKLTLEPEYSGKIQVSFPIREWQEPQRMALANDSDIKVIMVNGLPDVWYPGHMSIEKRFESSSRHSVSEWVVARPDSDSTEVAIAAAVEMPEKLSGLRIEKDTTKNGVSVNLNFVARKGIKYTFCKYIGIVSSRESAKFLTVAEKVASEAKSKGYDEILEQHERAWHKLWKTNVTIQGNPQLQKVIHSCMFYLLCSVREGSGFGIPPMGLSSDGYYGHIFWDSDTWMFPPLLLMHPEIAKSMVMFRYKSLPAAEANAKLNGYRGAMYPWESDENGDEACPKFAYQNALYENHVTGDVAFAQWQYFLATEDTTWLKECGFPVIKETAEYWTTRATWDSVKRRYNINHVVSVDEGLIGVNNDAYTNLVAKRNLEIASKAASLLKERIDPKWDEIDSKLYIPYDSVNHCYLTYEDAPPQSLGAVVPLLYYPLELNVPDNVKRNDLNNAFNYTLKVGGWNGVMMGITLYQNVAAEINDRELFDKFFKLSYKPYLRPPFNVLAETPQNMSTNFLTGAGGFLQQVLFGYTGLRITDAGLVNKYAPMLPEKVTKMTLTGIHFRGKTYKVVVTNGKTIVVKE
jgi:trehalose/maltose hydrolase-like predicted phosphorylase